MKSANRKLLEFTANPNNPELSQRKNRQNDFLHFLAQGESIHDACALAGVTRFPFEQWRRRKKEFRPAVEAAAATIDSTAQPQHGTPDKPYKAPQTQSVTNTVQNQRHTPIQTPKGSTVDFFNIPDKIQSGILALHCFGNHRIEVPPPWSTPSVSANHPLPEADAIHSFSRPQISSETVRSVRLEGADRATESCCKGKASARAVPVDANPTAFNPQRRRHKSQTHREPPRQRHPPRRNPAGHSIGKGGNPQIGPLWTRPACCEASCHALPMAHTIVEKPFHRRKNS